LGAAGEGMEKATQKILASAEAVDDCARALAAALSNDYHHGLAQDVQDHVVRIYEACNFQDLAGQRIGKVIALLIMIEEKLAAMIACNSGTGARPAEAAPRTELINGPRLDGAAGHASQGDVDAMFAYAGRRVGIKQTNAMDATPAASANAAGSDARSTANAITSGAADCISRNGAARRPINRP